MPRAHNESIGLPPRSGLFVLTRTHALMTAGEAVMTIALANSLFLSISPDAARGKVILFLALSLATFSVVTPFIGPLVDRMRGGRRLVVVLAASLRGLVSFLMIGRIDSLTLFPLAFAALVLSKTYSVSKSALVPTVVQDDEALVEANSRLGLVSGIVGFAAAVPAGIIQLISPNATLALSFAVFVIAAISAWQLPRDVRIAEGPRTEREVRELRSRRIRRTVAAMRLMRGLVGLMFFHMAFWLRDQKAGTVWFGFAVSLSALATMSANAIAPIVRRHLREETMIVVTLIVTAAGGLTCTWVGGVTGGVVLVAIVNASAAICRLAYEAVIQSDAPDANRARAFASFETQFQLAWVGAGLVPVVLRLPGEFGFFSVGLVAMVGTLLFVLRVRVDRTSRAGRATGRARRSRRG